MANYNSIIDPVQILVKIGSRTRTNKVGTTMKTTCNVVSFPLIKYMAVRTTINRNGMTTTSARGLEVMELKRTNTIRAGKVAFSLSSFSKVSPRKRPWDGINRKNSI